MSYCNQCGKNLYPSDQFCAGCGKPNTPASQPDYFGSQPNMQPQAQPFVKPQGNGMATAGFVCALIGVLVFPLEILGLIFSIIGLNRAKVRGGVGRELAIIGLILAAIGFVRLFMEISGGTFWLFY